MGVKISNLPAVVTPSMSDIFPIVQSGVTYKESFTQLSSLFATAGANTNITSLGGLTTPLSGAQGGTGVNNSTRTLTLAGNLQTVGAFNSVFTMTAGTTVTFPTTGTLATTAGTVSSVSGTANRITSTGGTNPVIDISASYVGQASITTLGTIGTGVWQGTLVGPTYGGTGVNNGSNTLTLAGTLATSGAFASVFTMTGATNVTFPTSGTLATTAGTAASIQGTANQVLANGTSGAPVTGAVILTTPQNIGTTSTPTFGGMSLTAASTPALNIAATSATGIPYVQFFRNTSTSIGVIQPGSTSDGSATGNGLWINNGIAGGSIYMNITGTGNALTISPTASTFLGATDTSLNIVSSSATGMPYVQWTNNSSTAINYIQAGTNVTGNASSTGTLFVNNIAGGDFFFNVTGTGNLLTLGIAASTFTKNVVLSAGELHVGTAAGGGAQIIDIFAPTAAMGVLQFLSNDNAGNFLGRVQNASLTAARTWTLPDASGTIALTSGSGGLTAVSVAGTTQALSAGNAYIFNNAGATTGTLPTSGSSTIGDLIKIKGRSAAPWIIQANTGQIITDGSVSSSVAGTATSAAGTDSIQLMYVAANEWSTDWALSSGIVLA